MSKNLRSSIKGALSSSIKGGLLAPKEHGGFRGSTLDLDFAGAKSLKNQIGRKDILSFTRASSATYVDGDGLIKTAAVDEARFDHDPVTGESLGLLIEEARTNDISSNFSTGSSKQTVTLSEVTSIINPDGTAGAVKVTATTSNGQHAITTSASAESTNHCVSVFVKKGNHRYVGMTLGGSSNNIHCVFDFDTKTIIDDGGRGTHTFVSAGFEEYANGWFRLHVVGFTNGSSVRIFLAENGQQNGMQNWTASGSEFMYVWGPQKEEGSFPTSYIPTSGSTVTRAADVAEITGADFAKTNLLLYSERFDETWTTTGTIVPNATTAPDGTLTADKFFTDSSASSARLSQNATVANGIYTLSFYAKAGDSTSGKCVVKERQPNGNDANATYNLNNGTITVNSDGSGALTNHGIESVGDGWYRIFMTFNKASGAELESRLMDFGSFSNKDGLFFWGAQLEEGDVLTDYTPSVESFDSRASTATYVDDATGLIKTTPVNKLRHSEDPSQNVWFKSNVSGITTGQLAPDNTNTAAKFEFTDVNNWFISQDTVSVVGQAYIGHVYIKGSANATLGLRRPGMSGTTIGGSGTASINVTTEWQKFEAITTSAENTAGKLLVDGRTGNGASVPAGFELFIWHPQVEDGTTANPYVKTGSTISGAARYENGELILEEARTNRLPYSERFDNWTIGASTTVTPNQVVAPDGTLTADRVLMPLGGGSQVNVPNVVQTGIIYTASVWAKAVTTGSDDKFRIRIGGLNSSEFTTTGEWQRFTFTGTTNTAGSLMIKNADQNNTTSDIYFWGAQLEEGSFLTSYIPTDGSAATRAADVSTSALGVDSFYNQSEGTMFVHAGTSFNTNDFDLTEYSNGTTNNRHTVRYEPSNTRVAFTGTGGATSQQYVSLSSPANIKAAATQSLGFAVNGVLTGSAGTSNSGTKTQLTIGFRGVNGADYINGHIKRLSYFPTRLPDATLQSITS